MGPVIFPPLPEPMRLEFEITNHCNGHCEFCPRRNIKDKGFMDLEKYRFFVSQVKDVKPCLLINKLLPGHYFPTFVFGGYGEALYHPLFFEFVKVARDQQFRTELITNGFLLTEENCKRILDSGVNQLSISLHTLDRQINLELMGVDALPRIERAIHYFEHSPIDIELWRVARFDGRNYDPREKPGDYSTFLSKYAKKIKVLGPTPAWNRGGQFSSMFWPSVNDSEQIRCQTAYFGWSVAYNGDIVLCCCDFSLRGNVLAHDWDFNFNTLQKRILDRIKHPPRMCLECRRPRDNHYQSLYAERHHLS